MLGNILCILCRIFSNILLLYYFFFVLFLSKVYFSLWDGYCVFWIFFQTFFINKQTYDYSFWYVFDRLLYIHFGDPKLLEQNFFRSVRRTGGSESRDGLSADRAQGDGGTGSELYDRTK